VQEQHYTELVEPVQKQCLVNIDYCDQGRQIIGGYSVLIQALFEQTSNMSNEKMANVSTHNLLYIAVQKSITLQQLQQWKLQHQQMLENLTNAQIVAFLAENNLLLLMGL
jgi:hypothetical protein